MNWNTIDSDEAAGLYDEQDTGSRAPDTRQQDTEQQQNEKNDKQIPLQKGNYNG